MRYATASPTLAGNASHALLAQLRADGTATVARDAHYALVHHACVARSAAPHSGARRALLRQGPRAHRRGACTLGPRGSPCWAHRAIS